MKLTGKNTHQVPRRLLTRCFNSNCRHNDQKFARHRDLYHFVTTITSRPVNHEERLSGPMIISPRNRTLCSTKLSEGPEANAEECRALLRSFYLSPTPLTFTRWMDPATCKVQHASGLIEKVSSKTINFLVSRQGAIVPLKKKKKNNAKIRGRENTIQSSLSPCHLL